ncbi:MAG: DUF2784 domain-containing protein [Deltaproteobacteria bacterium]|nr:DUF2784 domain-containing protein [Deltaproteobacteria bacterium]
METSHLVLQLSDFFLDAFHACFMIFVTIGWAFRKTRKIHLLSVALVVFSWVVLGIWYGIGYCFVTDLHWAIKHQLGETELPNSYIAYFVQHLFGVVLSDLQINVLSVAILIAAVILSIILNIRDWKQNSFS